MGYLFKGVWIAHGDIKSVPVFRIEFTLADIKDDMAETYLNICNYKNKIMLAKEKKRMRILRKMRRLLKDELKERE